MKIVICDIDGCLADNRHRLHHIACEDQDWEAYHTHTHLDDPIVPLIHLLHLLEKEYRIFLLTGRRSEERDKTVTWLEEYDVPFYELQMPRNRGDHRPNAKVKEVGTRDILANLEEPPTELIIVEDDPSTVEMYKENFVYSIMIQPHLIHEFGFF